MPIEYILLFIVTPLVGAWATGIGVLFGLEPISVWLTTVVSSVLANALILFVAGPWRDRIFTRYFPNAQEQVDNSPVGGIVDRWGIPGLAASSLVIGPTLSLAAVLILGVNRKRYFLWTTAVDLIGLGIATAFWSLVLG